MPDEAEALNAAVFAVGDIDDSVPIDSDPVRQVELARAGSGRAPFADSSARAALYSRILALAYPSEIKMRPPEAKAMSVVPQNSLLGATGSPPTLISTSFLPSRENL